MIDLRVVSRTNQAKRQQQQQQQQQQPKLLILFHFIELIQRMGQELNAFSSLGILCVCVCVCVYKLNC